MSYYYDARTAGLGFSLKPPKIIRKAAKAVGHAVVTVVKKAAPLAIFVPGVGPVLAAGIAAGASALPGGGGGTQTFATAAPAPVAASPVPSRVATGIGPSNQATLLLGGALLAALLLSQSQSRRG